MDSTAWLGIVRHVLTTVGGIFVAKGYIDDTGVESLAGALVAIAGVVWSIFEKRSRPKVPASTS